MELQHFRSALTRHPEAAIELSDDTRDRYKRGQIPKVILWLLRHPALIKALADDARALSDAADQPAA